MGIADEADRTLFVGNLDPQVTEEVIFELFLQVSALVSLINVSLLMLTIGCLLLLDLLTKLIRRVFYI